MAKIDYLVGYLRGLDAEDLETATRWLTGEALPRRAGRRSLNVGSATIKLDLESMDGSLEKVEFLSKRLFELHPSEGELVVRLLTGNLRIGLKEGLVEEALGVSFQAGDSILRQANMLTGDLGRTAVLAKEGRLSEATLTPLVPIRCMLASPLERDESDDRPKFADLPFSPPFWLEPKYDGNRAQLHKVGGEVGLFCGICVRSTRSFWNSFRRRPHWPGISFWTAS